MPTWCGEMRYPKIPKAAYRGPFHLNLSDEERSMLVELARLADLSPSAYLRNLIRTLSELHVEEECSSSTLDAEKPSGVPTGRA